MKKQSIKRSYRALIALLILIGTNAWSQSLTNISGEVSGLDDEKLSAIWVRVYSGLTSLVNTITDENGAFSLQIEPNNGPITLRFDSLSPDVMVSYHPEIMDNISSNKDSIIIKVMAHKSAQGFGKYELAQIISNYDKVYVLDADLLGKIDPTNTITRPANINRYISMIGMLKHVDERSENELARVTQLYDQFRPD